jgi:hypothetical protein
MAVQSISKVIANNPVVNGRVVTAVQKTGAYQTGPDVSTLRNFQGAPVSTNDFTRLNTRYNLRWDDPTYYG